MIDLAWQGPVFDAATRQLVGYELFRDDMSTRPPSRRTWKTMSNDILEVRGLEDLPRSEYGVQPIWRLVAGEPLGVIEYGPPRLSTDTAGPRQVVVPPEERIHSLAWLQRDGLITSDELEQTVEQLLGGRALPEPEPTQMGETPSAPKGSTTSPNRRRLVLTYAVAAVVLIIVVAVAGQLAGRFLFARQPAAHITSSPTPTLPSPSPSPTPSAVSLTLKSILIRLTDLRSGYVAGPYDSSPLCSACVPAAYSLSVVFQDRQLKRSVVTGASVALTAADSGSVLQALMAGRSWAKGTGLGDESYTATSTSGGLNYFYVVWRSGVVTEEIVLVAPPGARILQNAMDLAKVQQARAAAALARS